MDRQGQVYVENSSTEKGRDAIYTKETSSLDRDSDHQREHPDWITNADPKWLASITRKMDVHILPVMSVLYLMSFLDRTNIGNARIVGLATDLKLTNATYNMCLTVFFFTYCAFEVPSNLALKKIGARIWLPFIMILWGGCSVAMGFVTGYHSLLVTRLALGATEAGLFPGVAYYMTTWYPRQYIAFRIAVFFSAATIAGAFGGLLAFGIDKMRGIGGLQGWRWIFIIEGILTVVVAIVAYFFIHNTPNEVSWLTPEEKQIAEYRITHDGYDTPMDDSFQWKYVVSALVDWKLYLNLLVYVGSATPLYSIAYFLPTIIRALGYTAEAAQLRTVPVYVLACLGVMGFSYIADRIKMRSPVIIAALGIAMIGWGMAYSDAIKNPNIKYTAMFIAALGSYSSFPPVVALLSGNIAGRTKRAVAIAVQVGFGGMAGAVAANMFRTQDAPKYQFGIRLCLYLSAMGVAAVMANWVFLIIGNKQKQKAIESGRAAQYTKLELSQMGEHSPYFAYRY